MGLLGLIQLKYFARKYTINAMKILNDSLHPRRYYPFSVTGINITAFVIEMLRENRFHFILIHKLESQLLSSNNGLLNVPNTFDLSMFEIDDKNDTELDSSKELLLSACSCIHEIYCDIFVAFNDLWVLRDPPNIMHFHLIFDEIKKRFQLEYPALGK
jgi:hypothetical protein